MIKKTLRFYVEFGISSLILISIIYYFVKTGNTSLEQFQNLVVDSGKYSYLVYYILFVILALIGISVTPLILLAGFLFGVQNGFLISAVSLISTSIIAFNLSNFISSEIIKKYHPNYHIKFVILDNVIKKLKNSVEKNCFKTIFFMKFIVSNVIVSYALGLISQKVNLFKYLLASILNNLIYCFVLIYLGSKFTENKIYFLIAFGFIMVYYLVRYALKKKHSIIKKNHFDS